MALRDIFKRKPRKPETPETTRRESRVERVERVERVDEAEINDLSKKLFASHIPGWNGSKGQQRLRKAVGLG
jgi:hypothetical protein